MVPDGALTWRTEHQGPLSTGTQDVFEWSGMPQKSQKSRWCPVDRPLQPTPKRIAHHLLSRWCFISGAIRCPIQSGCWVRESQINAFLRSQLQPMGDIRQEAQRLGRILRPKPQATTTAGGFNVPWFAMRSKGTRSQGANIVSIAKMKFWDSPAKVDWSGFQIVLVLLKRCNKLKPIPCTRIRPQRM